jgi:hypothetical protein
MKPKYMTPLEVEEVMKRLWHHDYDLLNLLYTGGVTSIPSSPDVSTAQHSTAQEGELPAAKARAVQQQEALVGGYRVFFLRAVAVAPNKFRTPSKLGEEM